MSVVELVPCSGSSKCPGRCVLAPLCGDDALRPRETRLGAEEPVPSGDAVYVIKQGCIRSEFLQRGIPWVDFHLPGELFGWHKLSEPGVAVHAWATAPSCLCRIARQSLIDRLQGDPARFSLLINALAREASRSASMLVRARKSCDAKLADFLLDLALRVSGDLAGGSSGPPLRLDMTRMDLARHLFMSPEMLNRTLARMSECGILVVDGRDVRIIETASLRMIGDGRLVWTKGRFASPARRT